MNLMPFSDDLSEIKIRKYPKDEFGDAPDNIRWRAFWDNGPDSRVIGVQLQCYPVLKTTPKGAWIDPIAYHHGEWVTHDFGKKWVSNDGGQAWAKPTQDEALYSLQVRFERWANRVARDIGYFMAASNALMTLWPEKERMVKNARQVVIAQTKRDFNETPPLV